MALSFLCRRISGHRVALPCGIAAAVGLTAFVAAIPASAQVNNYVLFKSAYETQTGPATSVPFDFAFDARIFQTTAGDASAVSLTYPGPGSPENVPIAGYSPLVFDANSNFASQAAMDSAFPFGTYTANWSAGTFGSGSASIDYTEDAYAGDTPLFTPTTFSGFGSENAAQPLTLDWNSMITGGVADSSFVFLTIFDGVGATVFSDSFMPASTTGLTVPADTLQPGMTYTADLDFSNRVSGESGAVTTTFGWDRSTDATITTIAAAPEPGALPLAACGVLATAPMLGVGLRRMVRRRCAP